MNLMMKTLVLTALAVLVLVSVIWAGNPYPPKPGLDVPATVQARIRNLSDPDVTVRCCGATALGVIGPAAMKAVPALLQALCDSNSRVQAAAALALHRIDPATFETVPKLSLSRGD
jgi:HEAT repeat protein